MTRWWQFFGLGLLLALTHAPVGLKFVLIGALAFALLSAAKAPTPRRAALWGWSFGAGYFGLALCWIVEPMLVEPAQTGWMAPFALLFMGGGLALFWALAFWAGSRLSAASWRIPALALCLAWAEAARAFLLTGFPWADFAQAAMDTPMALLLPLGGPRMLGAVVLALAVGLALLMKTRRAYGLAAAALIGAALQALPGPSDSPAPQNAPIVRLVQPNAPQAQKWDPAFQREFHSRLLAATAADGRADLIIWPEMSLTLLLDHAREDLERIARAARGVPVILGAPRLATQGYYNSLSVIGAGGRELALYDKAHLVPFGEYMPLSALAERLGIYGLASGSQGYVPGTARPVFDLEGIGLIRPLICYEGIFAEEVRGGADRPRLLVLITNDAWFGDWIGPKQHLVQGRMRALELGLPMARAANTGISAMIDARGQVTSSLGMGLYGQIEARLPRALPPTLYARLGEVPFFILMGVLSLALLYFRFEDRLDKWLAS